MTDENSNVVVYSFYLDFSDVDATITIEYYDEDNNLLSPSEVSKGKIGEDFNPLIKDIDGYGVILNENVLSKYEELSDTTRLIYRKLGKVKIKYLDSNGEKLSENTILEEFVGNDYQVSPKIIEGYSVYKVEGNERGIYENSPTDITYRYKKDVDNTDNTDNTDN
ncbi:MucBP domain-containing protein, partial [Enterococcus faecalis]|uniref:MucBP domain-containing protein n=1 Tax=Enterococcus faecalis TaxID=1351 RepID=UPI0003547686